MNIGTKLVIEKIQNQGVDVEKTLLLGLLLSTKSGCGICDKPTKYDDVCYCNLKGHCRQHKSRQALFNLDMWQVFKEFDKCIKDGGFEINEFIERFMK